ncbi:sel1 repeat family protein [Legionella taurinensis]|uniref:Sel1 repeat family protein n=1 Tax=Legionella taurinensis TaxID=70611 RepID=A0AB38N7L8_9GAMM|nr:sel1 repeat family protein [Legionella taurinensis]MDX1836866.1 sel1 repeat family protein [Legionella taurinensis]PUT41281.1 hypothetical protein DB744_04185 [Legionella taurinensis]PUT42406.1 hypothetical protein DB746_08115 [Legionella taurinensis]PUT43932.1 hypothetical protein DB743_10065 [Legionella taurinensis]PUT47187.1 hypothetical protein DB745_09195 [Legionella taurinensis]
MILFKGHKVKSLTKKIKSMQQSRVHNQPTEDMVTKETGLYHQLASVYKVLRGHKKFPFADEMVWETLRASTNLDDSAAQYELGSHLLEEAKFRDELQRGGVFASPSNERQMRQLYDEALAYLQAAEALGHVQAKRLHGLCYINGWGVTVDRDKGFELVVASIEQDNSWDKVPQIFAAIGLNKPEFFSALMKRRSGGGTSLNT